jgi:hypothetical protein
MPPTGRHFTSERGERATDAKDFDAVTKRLEAMLDRRGCARAALAGADGTAENGNARNRRR